MASMDGLSLLAATHELQCLIGGKIDKIQQPERDIILLTVHAGGSNYKLLLSAHPENGRVQLTNAAFENPQAAPAFCMLLRKRLLSARIIEVAQPSLDRVLRITIEAVNELGDIGRLALYLELMGKYSNLVFVSEAGGVIDCVRHVGVGMSSVRVLLPGVTYALPPVQDKQDPRTASEEDFYTVLSGAGRVNKLLTAAFFGLAPHMAEQLTVRATGLTAVYAERMHEGEKRLLASALHAFYQEAASGVFSPCILHSEAGEAVVVYPFLPAAPKESITRTATISEALDLYYKERDMQERIRRRSAAILRVLQNNLERCQKKLAMFEETLHTEDKLEELCLYGELITANLHGIRKGERYAKLANYYSEDMIEVIVPLDERLSPQENAQRYFKKYQKGKAAKALAAAQKEETQSEIVYLDGQLDNLGKCQTDAEMSELRQELEQEGYIKPEAGRKKQAKLPPSKPLHYIASDGTDIYVGKNNRQNDTLTLRFAEPNDIWMHTKNIPGSHVILRCAGTASNEALREGAMLAAYYSKGRDSSTVPVDYCQRKYVKKPAGAKPGMVIYTTNKTLYVTPDEAVIRAMRTGQ